MIDTDAVAEIYLKCRQDTFHWRRADFHLEDFSKDIQGEVIWVAVEDSKPVGFISVWMEDSFIHHLYVDESYHREGVGKLLLSHALSQMPKPARLKCVVRNLKACAFYERLGWRIESTADDSATGLYYNYILG